MSDDMSYSEVTRNKKIVKIDEHMEDASGETATNGSSKCFY